MINDGLQWLLMIWRFPKMGDPPEWMVYKWHIPNKNGWELGVAIFQETFRLVYFQELLRKGKLNVNSMLGMGAGRWKWL